MVKPAGQNCSHSWTICPVLDPLWSPWKHVWTDNLSDKFYVLVWICCAKLIYFFLVTYSHWSRLQHFVIQSRQVSCLMRNKTPPLRQLNLDDIAIKTSTWVVFWLKHWKLVSNREPINEFIFFLVWFQPICFLCLIFL